MFTNRTTNPAPAINKPPKPKTLRRFASAKVVAAAATAVTASTLAGIPLLSATAAQAIPFGQQACAHENLTITPPGRRGQPGAVRWPGAVGHLRARPPELVAFLSIDSNVSSSTGAEMRASWSAWTGATHDFEYGPGNIHEGDGPFEGANSHDGCHPPHSRYARGRVAPSPDERRCWNQGSRRHQLRGHRSPHLLTTIASSSSLSAGATDQWLPQGSPRAIPNARRAEALDCPNLTT